LAREQRSGGRREQRDSPSHNVGNEWLAALLGNGRLTPKGAVVGHYIAANPRFASFASASDLAERTNVNVATVIRFVQSLGFGGWPEFQLHLRHNYLGSLLPSGVMRNHSEDDGDAGVTRALRRDVQNLEATAASLDVEKVQEVARLIAGANRTLIVGGGSHLAPGLMLAHLGHFMGFDIQLESRGPVHIVAALSTFQPGDCVITMNFWRVLKHVMDTTLYCRKAGITTIALTDSLFSPLAQASDHALIAPTESVSFFQSLTAPTSLVHGLLAELHLLGGERVDAMIERLEQAYSDLDVFHPPSQVEGRP
jgi:DNA-binding MurR/RpiR family transcriptional regulator